VNTIEPKAKGKRLKKGRCSEREGGVQTSQIRLIVSTEKEAAINNVRTCEGRRGLKGNIEIG